MFILLFLAPKNLVKSLFGLRFFGLLVGLLFAFVTAPTEAWSNKDVSRLFNTGKLIAPEYRALLSPGFAVSLTEGEVIKNLYDLSVISHPKSPRPMSLKLLRLLFHRIEGDRVILLPSNSEKMYYHYLISPDIGRVIHRILSVKDWDKVSLVQHPTLRSNLIHILTQGLPPECQKHSLTNHKITRARIDRELSTLGNLIGVRKRTDFLSKVQGLVREGNAEQKFLRRNLARWEELDNRRCVLNQAINIETGMLELIDTLLAAIDESKDPSSFFPIGFPIQLLLSFALLRSDSYQYTLVEIWKQMEEFLSEEGRTLIHHPDSAMRFENYALTPMGFFDLFFSRFYGPKAPTSLLPFYWEPEKILGLSSQAENASYYVRKPPPLLNQFHKKVVMDVLGGRIESSDCCEASFFNFVTYFTRVITTGGRRSYRPNNQQQEDIFSFMYRLPAREVTDPSSEEVRSTIKRISSNIPGLDYYESIGSFRFDLKPSLENFLGLMEYFYKLEPEPYAEQSERLFRLCSRIQYDGRAVDCFLNRSDPTFTQILFTTSKTDGSPLELFTLSITPKHCNAAPAGPSGYGFLSEDYRINLDEAHRALASTFPDPDGRLAVPAIAALLKPYRARASFEAIGSLAGMSDSQSYKQNLFLLLNTVHLQSQTDRDAYASTLEHLGIASAAFLIPAARERDPSIPGVIDDVKGSRDRFMLARPASPEIKGPPSLEEVLEIFNSDVPHDTDTTRPTFIRVVHPEYGVGWQDRSFRVWSDNERNAFGGEIKVPFSIAQALCGQRGGQRGKIPTHRKGVCHLPKHEDLESLQMDLSSGRIDYRTFSRFLQSFFSERKFWVETYSGKPASSNILGAFSRNTESEIHHVRCICEGPGWEPTGARSTRNFIENRTALPPVF